MDSAAGPGMAYPAGNPAWSMSHAAEVFTWPANFGAAAPSTAREVSLTAKRGASGGSWAASPSVRTGLVKKEPQE